jgi:Domain of unknown function (DUF4070)
LPNTQLSRRLAREGRLHPNAELSLRDDFIWGLNFETKRPRREILKDYVDVLDTLFTPEAYFSRLRGQCRAIKRPKLKTRVGLGTSIRLLEKLVRALWGMTTRDGSLRREFWHTVLDCSRKNIHALRYAVILSVTYLDWGSFGRSLSEQIKRETDLIDRGEWQPPARSAPGG